MGSCIPGKSKIQIKKFSFKTNKESIKNINENNSFNKINKNDNFFNENKQKFNSSNNNFLSAQPKIILVNNNKFIINTNVSNNTNDVSNENEQKIILMNNEFEDKKKLSCQNILNIKCNSEILNENHNINLIEQKTSKMKGPILNKLKKYSKKIKKKELN
jgi:hypothetical protein